MVEIDIVNCHHNPARGILVIEDDKNDFMIMERCLKSHVPEQFIDVGVDETAALPDDIPPDFTI